MIKRHIINEITEYIKAIEDNTIEVISILVICNESYEYKGIRSFPKVTINYIKTNDCCNLSSLSEEKWNIAFWDDRKEYSIIDSESNIVGAEILYNWYIQNNIKNIGYEDETLIYDNDMNYIGRGPNGYWELYEVIADSIYEIRKSKLLNYKIKGVPIIIHDYEYTWYTVEFTVKANPNNEATSFLKFYDNEFN